MSINIEYNSKEIRNIVLTNILKMLTRRNLIDLDLNIDIDVSIFKKLDIDIYSIDLNENTQYIIYIIHTKLNNISQNTVLNDYLLDKIDIHKIIIGTSVSKRVVKQIINDYKNTEFFFEYEMMEDIPSKIFIPEHILLNADDKNKILSHYSELELAKIFSTDMMSRYYYAKPGDIFKIIRPSITAGKNIFYRIVVIGSLDILFP